MDTKLIIVAFLTDCCTEDVIIGAVWVGDANGTYGTDWQIHNETALLASLEHEKE